MAASDIQWEDPVQCSSLRKNDIVMIKGHPCKIVEISTSNTGKHGDAQVHLVGIDIFDGKKYEDICPSTHNVDVPKVSWQEYSLVELKDDGYMSLMDESGVTWEHIKAESQDFKTQLEKLNWADGTMDTVVTVVSALGQEKAISAKGRSGK